MKYLLPCAGGACSTVTVTVLEAPVPDAAGSTESDSPAGAPTEDVDDAAVLVDAELIEPDAPSEDADAVPAGHDKKPGRGARFSIVTNLINPRTGEIIIDEDKIEQVLEEHASIKRFAWIVHNKDFYTDEDEAENPEHQAGMLKADHVHIVIDLGNTKVPLQTIANWFGVPVGCVSFLRGRNALLDAIEYITHEHPRQQEAGKHRYPDEEVHSNFDWRSELTRHQEARAKGRGDLGPKQRMRLSVSQDGKTLLQCEREDPVTFADDLPHLKKLRGWYLQHKCDPPGRRVSIFMFGGAGTGKSVLSYATGRGLAAVLGIPADASDAEIYYDVGGLGVEFDAYDGQSVIIYNDKRATDMMGMFGGRSGLFDALDPNPRSCHTANVKYSSATLVNAVSVVNSVQPFGEFVSAVAGEEDRGQVLRRFAAVVEVSDDGYTFWTNDGTGPSGRPTYVTAPIARMEKACQGSPELAREFEARAAKPLVERLAPMLEAPPAPDRGELDEMFKDLGSAWPLGASVQDRIEGVG